MSGSKSFIFFKAPILSRKFAAAFLSARWFLIAWIPVAFAQEPPRLCVGFCCHIRGFLGRLPSRDPSAIAVNGWLLYPTMRGYSLYKDNLFLSPLRPIAAAGFGITPSLTAVWSNGIHTTTLYGNIDEQVYPTDNQINSLGGRAGFTQKYEAMRDLIFSVNGDFIHATLTSWPAEFNPDAAAAPATTILPNGNTLLPNGTILSPCGQKLVRPPPQSGSYHTFTNGKSVR